MATRRLRDRRREFGVDADSASRSLNLFRREGEYWTVAYDGLLVRLRDCKGMRCIAHLLAHPRERIPANSLACAAVETGGDATADGERARLAATKRIRTAVARIHACHPSLAHHLNGCIRTGSICSYVPDPAHPVLWVLR